MRNRLTGVTIALAASAVTALWFSGNPVAGQAPRTVIPRTSDGRPDLNGIWQVLNTAN
jgi:hypothetical protein